MKLHYEWKCPFCDLVFDSRRKLKNHKNDFHNKEHKQYIFSPGGKCQYCGEEHKLKCHLSLHEKHCKLNPNRVIYKGHPVSEETKNKIRKTNSIKHTMGGYRKGSGRGKKGNYKGYWCDSSWELAFVIYNLEHNIKFERNKRKFVYVYEGKELNYLPDFIIDGKYIEIKGYSSKQWEAKFNQFPKEETLEVIDKHTIKPYINYVEQKYGKNYITLYENSIYKKDKKKIKIKKELKNIQKHKEAELNGLIRSDGRIDGNGITNKQWLERKNIILNSGVDFSKYGWKSEVQRKTTLTRRQIDNTIKHFKIDFDFVFSKKINLWV